MAQILQSQLTWSQGRFTFRQKSTMLLEKNDDFYLFKNASILTEKSEKIWKRLKMASSRETVKS